MVPEQAVLPLLAVAGSGSLTLFRYSTYDVPFWARPNTRSGRWHWIGDPPTQYWSMSPDAAWAELIRAESLRTEGDLDLLRMPLWVARVSAMNLIDLRDEVVLEHLSVSRDILIADNWSACQELGRRLRGEGHPGVIAPCAALDGHHNVTLFGARRQIAWTDQPALARTLPAAVAAIGRPRVGLISLVQRPSDQSGLQRLF